MKVIFRALILAIGFLVVLKILSWLFAKVVFFAVCAAVVGIILYVAYSILKTA